jgi:hypothetical protein
MAPRKTEATSRPAAHKKQAGQGMKTRRGHEKVGKTNTKIVGAKKSARRLTGKILFKLRKPLL